MNPLDGPGAILCQRMARGKVRFLPATSAFLDREDASRYTVTDDKNVQRILIDGSQELYSRNLNRFELDAGVPEREPHSGNASELAELLFVTPRMRDQIAHITWRNTKRTAIRTGAMFAVGTVLDFVAPVLDHKLHEALDLAYNHLHPNTHDAAGSAGHHAIDAAEQTSRHILENYHIETLIPFSVPVICNRLYGDGWKTIAICGVAGAAGSAVAGPVGLVIGNIGGRVVGQFFLEG